MILPRVVRVRVIQFHDSRKPSRAAAHKMYQAEIRMRFAILGLAKSRSITGPELGAVRYQ